jgi:enoyl-CoA hydratase/carnithine racemase
VRGAMEVIVGSEDKTLEELLQAERKAVNKTFGSPDLQEGMMAFLEKRKPIFNK